MKICDITHFYTTKSGGVKTYLLQKVDYINRNELSDVEHCLILPNAENRLENRGISRFHFVKSPTTVFWKPYRALINKHKIKNLLSDENPDIVEIGSPYGIPSWIKHYKRDLKYKVVGFYHSHIEETLLLAMKSQVRSKTVINLIRNYIRRVYCDMDLVLTPSRHMEKYLNELGVPNTQALHLGVDVELFCMGKAEPGFREEHGISEDKTILLFAGRFAKEKRIYMLIDAFNTLNRQNPGKYHLVLIGGGPEEEKISNMVIKDGTVLPYCHDRESLARIYNSADLFITASTSETFGLSLLEAQCCGLPVVAFKSTSIPEVSCRQEFLADDINDIDEFINKIETASNLLCPAIRAEMRDFCVHNFSWDRTFDNLFAIYSSICPDSSHLADKAENSKYQKDFNPEHRSKDSVTSQIIGDLN